MAAMVTGPQRRLKMPRLDAYPLAAGLGLLLRLASRLGACRPPAHLPRAGSLIRSRSPTSAPCVSLFGPSAARLLAHLLRRLLTSAPSRRALPRVALCTSMVVAACSLLAVGSSPQRLVLGIPGEPIRVIPPSMHTLGVTAATAINCGG